MAKGGVQEIVGRTASALLLLLLLTPGCRDDPGVASGTETETESSGEASDTVGLDSTGAPPSACVPGHARACYEGPPGTEGVGACAAGQQICTDDGQGWSACAGEVWPQPQERCDTPEDDDCDGWSLCEPALEWVQSIPGTVHRVATTAAGHVIVVGTGGSGMFQDVLLYDTFVLELDPAGTLQWARNLFPGGSITPFGVAVDDRGAVTIVGHYNGAPNLGGGPLPFASGGDAFAVRYDHDGAYLWHHTATPAGYYAVALGPDGTTYVVGVGLVVHDDGREPFEASFFVEAIDPTGEHAWLAVGQGGYGVHAQGTSLAVTETGEVALGLALSGYDLALEGMPIELEGSQMVVVRMAADGTPLGYRAVPETSPLSIERVQIFARPGGLMAVGGVLDYDEAGSYGWQAMLAGLDTSLQPLSDHRVGQEVFLLSAAAHPSGATVLAVEFTGILELGPIGVGVPGYLSASAIAVIDDQGRAQWVEVLHTETFADVPTVAAAPDGAVVVGGMAFGDGAVLAGNVVVGPFVAKLRP